MLVSAVTFGAAGDHDSPLDLDGEIQDNTPVSIQIMPGAIHMFS